MLLLAKKKTKKLGYFSGNQILAEGTSILPRFPIHCEENNQMCKYEVTKEYYPLAMNVRPKYIMQGINFFYTCELDDMEYQIINKLIKINRMLEKGKINGDIHEMKIEKFKNKFKRS